MPPTIRVDESIYRNLVEVAKELGLSVDEIVNICLSNLSFLKMVVKEDVEGLGKVFSDVPRDRLTSLALSRVLFIAGGFYKVFRHLVKDLGFLDKGFIIEFADPVLDDEGNCIGMTAHFAASVYSEKVSNISSATLHVGVRIRRDGVEICRECGWLEVESFIGFKKELGNRYEDVKKRLEEALKDEEVTDALANLEDSLGCDIAEVNAKVLDMDDELSLYLEIFVDDYTCLPPIDEIEKIISLILNKAGVVRKTV